MYPYISFQIIGEKSRLEELAKKSPLFEAVLSDEAKSLEHLEKLLLEKGEAGKEEIANTVTEGGDSLLMLAIYKGHFDKALLLMKSGARVDTLNRDNVSVIRILTMRFRESVILNKDIEYSIKFLYHVLCEAQGQENIRKMLLTGGTDALNNLDYFLYQVSLLFFRSKENALNSFSYYHEVFKKLLALGANPVFPNGENIFHLVFRSSDEKTYNIVLELIRIFNQDAPKLLSQVNFTDLGMYEKLYIFLSNANSRVGAKPAYIQAIKILFEYLKNKVEQNCQGKIFPSCQKLAQEIVQQEKNIKSPAYAIVDALDLNFFDFDDILQCINSKHVLDLRLHDSFWSFGLTQYFEALPLPEDKLINCLNILKDSKNKPARISLDFSLFSERVGKLICLLPIEQININKADRMVPKELSESPANEVYITLSLENLSPAVDILKCKKNLAFLEISLIDVSKNFSYDTLLNPIISFFEYNKNIGLMHVINFDDQELIDHVKLLFPKREQPDEVSENQKEILKAIEQLFFHLSTCTNLTEFRFPFFDGSDPNVRKKIKECMRSNYTILEYGCDKGGIFIDDVEEKDMQDVEEFICLRNTAFAPLLKLYNQWVGILPLEPEFQSPSSGQSFPIVRGLEDNDVEMEPEPQAPAGDSKRAKEEGVVRVYTAEKETKMAKESQKLLDKMYDYARALAPAVKEKLLKAMITEIPNMDIKYRNECCYILATEFLRDRLQEEGSAAKILGFVQTPVPAIDPWYQKAQDALSFLTPDPKAILAHRLECRDEHGGDVIPRLVSSMHTDEDGDAFMDLVPPACYNLSLSGVRIAEFVDYSSKQYLATLKAKGKAEEAQQKAEAAQRQAEAELKQVEERSQNELQRMQARLQQIETEKDAEIKRLQEKNAELERIQERNARQLALSDTYVSQLHGFLSLPLSFSTSAEAFKPESHLHKNTHKRKADEINQEDGGSEKTKRLKTHQGT